MQGSSYHFRHVWNLPPTCPDDNSSHLLVAIETGLNDLRTIEKCVSLV